MFTPKLFFNPSSGFRSLLSPPKAAPHDKFGPKRRDRETRSSNMEPDGSWKTNADPRLMTPSLLGVFPSRGDDSPLNPRTPPYEQTGVDSYGVNIILYKGPSGVFHVDRRVLEYE